MWYVRIEKLPNDGELQYSIWLGRERATVLNVMDAWRTDTAFRAMFNEWLAMVPYSAFRWETPSVTDTTLSLPFEFVLIEDGGLDRKPDAEAFAEHFDENESGVVTFPNLSGDAVMVVPCPLGKLSAYGHLAAFVRHAPEAQRDALWQAVGEALAARIGPRPVWLSTAGAGVSWLHVRLDSRPKYYHHTPYRKPRG